MDNNNYTTNHRKGQHLSVEERYEIEIRLKDGWSVYRIARELNRPYNTVKNEIKRGTVLLYNGKVKRYKAKRGNEVYRNNRKNSRRQYKALKVREFLNYVTQHFNGEEKWSLDACAGRALAGGGFARSETVCTKTLYRYVDLGLILIKNIDLPEKLGRAVRRKRVRENRRILGQSIDERPFNASDRSEFGHWELDSVIGAKSKEEPCVMTLVERMTRNSLWIKLTDHSAETVKGAINKLMRQFGDRAGQVFKTITTDNGSEFAFLNQVKQIQGKVYFTHPYSSWEKGSNERHNRLLRRFIPKGRRISDYDSDSIMIMADIINGLPRKILNYATPEELFDRELDKIYTFDPVGD